MMQKYLINVQHKPSMKFIEGILVGLVGHSSASVRADSVRLLNILYDGHPWQMEEPLRPVVRVIGDAFRVEIDYDVGPLDPTRRIYLLTVAPQSFSRYLFINLECCSYLIHSTSPIATPDSIFSTHNISDRKSESSKKLIVEMRSFEKVCFLCAFRINL